MNLLKTLAIGLLFVGIGLAGGSPGIGFSYTYAAPAGCNCTPVSVLVSTSNTRTNLFQVNVNYTVSNDQGVITDVGTIKTFTPRDGFTEPTKVDVQIPAGAKVSYVLVIGFSGSDAKWIGGDGVPVVPGTAY